MEKDYIKYDGKDYAVLDIIENGSNKYIYLVNVKDPKDFFVRKMSATDNNGEVTLDNLSGKEEFASALKLFSDKHISELENL